MIHFVSSQPHYANHLLPLMDALVARGVEVESFDTQAVLADEPIATIIAGMGDQSVVPHCRPLALVDHGIGQQYFGVDHQSYNGGRNRERVSLFLYATRQGMAVNAARWSNATHVHAGPMTLDKWAASAPYPDDGAWHPTRARTGRFPPPHVVAFAWHFPLALSLEAMWAWPYYQPVIERLAQTGTYKLLGHAHPKAWEHIEGHYERFGIEQVRDLDEVFARADLLCIDNSSIMWEAAAIGIPVLALDAPHFRDQPRQPPRFYSDVPGLRLRAYRDQAPDDGIVHAEWGRDHLSAAIAEALEDRPVLKSQRWAVVESVYGGMLDGKAAERAADAVEAWARS